MGEIDATDEDSFRLLFESSYSKLVAYARRRALDRAEADDVVSEVFAVAWRRRGDIAADAPPLPWLYGIAANVLRNHRRAANRRLQLAEVLEIQPRRGVEADPAERMGAGIRAALRELSFDDQEVLRLVAWEGLSHAEVGVVLSCSTNAVGIRIHRARTRLREELAGQSQPHEEDTTS